jgi:DNA-binding MurR/RpiR family transcriptional regulator
MNTALNIKILYDKMGTAEKKIADFIMENPSAIIPLSVSELASQCGCGDATVVRFAKRLGFDGYQSLKISIAQDQNITNINENITANDSALAVFEKVCNDIYCSLEKTKNCINADSLEKVCSTIINANKIVVFGLGNSASIALDATHKLLRLGLNCACYTDNHMQAIASSHLNQDDVAIAITHSGSSKDIVQALQTAKDVNATTIAITNIGKSPIVKVSDYVLNTVSDETNYTILGLNSRISQLAIIDAIYSYLVCHLPNAKEFIAKTESALLNKKY